MILGYRVMIASEPAKTAFYIRKIADFCQLAQDKPEMGVHHLPYRERIGNLASCLLGKGRDNYQGVRACAVLSASVLCLQGMEKLLASKLSAPTLLALHLLTRENDLRQALIEIGSVEDLLQHELGLQIPQYTPGETKPWRTPAW